jgi:hypothetical protein
MMQKRVKKNATLTIDIENEVVKVMVDGVEASKAEFTFDSSQIMVTYVVTKKLYQKCGYGRLLFEGLKLISEQYKLPLILWSLDKAVSFYEKIGLLHLNKPEVQKRITFGNVEISELNKKVNSDDFVYIPQSLNKRKPIIYM